MSELTAPVPFCCAAQGAIASQGVTVVMQQWLASQGVLPGTPEFDELMQAASAAVGAAVGGGSGAVAALYGDKYNRQLHPKDVHYVADVLAQQYADQHGMPVEDARSLLLRGLFEYNDQFSTTFTYGTDTAQARADAKAFLYQHWATNPDGTQAYSMAVSDADFVNGNLGIATLLKDPEAYKYVQQALNPGGDPAIAAALEDYYTQQNKKDPQTIAAIDAYVRQQTNKDAMLLLSFAAPGLASTVEIGGKLWQGDYAGAGKQAATDALISAATFGVGKAVGVGFGVLKTAIKEGKAADKVAVAVGEAAKDAAKAVGSEASEVAAKQAVSTQNAIGFAPGVAEAATLGMRSGGGHAIRHLEGNLIPSTGSLQSRVEAFKSIVIPIPSKGDGGS